MIFKRKVAAAMLLWSIPIMIATSCSNHKSDHARLNGMWKSNREATVEEVFRTDPRWTNATPERIAKFKEIFGHMTITYSNGTYHWKMKDTEQTEKYKIVESGPTFIVIRHKGLLQDSLDSRLDFVEGGNGYWVQSEFMGSAIREKFDRISKKP